MEGLQEVQEMKVIDGKFGIVVKDGEPVIVKIASGEAVPDDEPLMLFRARDQNALEGALIPYRAKCEADNCNDYQMEGIDARIRAFSEFKKAHPGKMKQPGMTRGL